jgi:hypothetical protein
MMVILALLLFSLALAPETLPVWRFIFAGGGLLSFWGATGLWSATRDGLVLTREVLRTSSGEVLARVEDVQNVDRGAFAFKPSHGFLVTTTASGRRRWAPGLWWRAGRRVGVGGTLSGGETRAMAELLAALNKGILPSADSSEPF